MQKSDIKWYSISEYVDTETGEMLTKSRVEREYLIKKIITKTEIKDGIGTRKQIRECERNGQTSLWGDSEL